MTPNSNPNSMWPLKSGAPAHELTDEERKRGGSARSAIKAFHSVLNGMLAKPDLTERQRVYLSLLRNGELMDIFRSHFAQDLIYIENLEETGKQREAFEARQIIAGKILKVLEITSEHTKDQQELELLAEMVRCLRKNSEK